jgi:hypothetical protein
VNNVDLIVAGMTRSGGNDHALRPKAISIIDFKACGYSRRSTPVHMGTVRFDEVQIHISGGIPRQNHLHIS